MLARVSPKSRIHLWETLSVNKLHRSCRGRALCFLKSMAHCPRNTTVPSGCTPHLPLCPFSDRPLLAALNVAVLAVVPQKAGRMGEWGTTLKAGSLKCTNLWNPQRTPPALIIWNANCQFDVSLLNSLVPSGALEIFQRNITLPEKTFPDTDSYFSSKASFASKLKHHPV